MQPVRKFRIALIGLTVSTLCAYTLLRKAEAEPPERAQDPSITHRDDPCSHLPDPPGKATGIDKQCPPAGTSSGVVKGDFNGDGFADLAIGEPGATVSGAAGAGDVIVIYGSANGLTANTAGIPSRQLWYEGRVPGNPEAGDALGTALASGDFNGDGFSDLAIGVPGKNITTYGIFDIPTVHQDVGVVVILYGSKNGLTTIDPTVPAPQLFDVRDSSDFYRAFSLDGARFGQSLAWGNFNNDQANGHPIGDLAIGAPGASAQLLGVTVIAHEGAVFVIPGRAGTGLPDPGFGQVISEFGSLGLADQAGDSLGAALAAGDFNGDGFSDLAIGAPGRASGSLSAAGLVIVVGGSASGIDTFGIPPQFLAPEIFLGTAAASDEFGSVLAAGDFNGDSKSDLAIGVPNRDIGPLTNAGVVVVGYGDSRGILNGLQQLWAGAHFHPGVNEANARFGAALGAGDFNGDLKTDLAIGVPLKNIVVTRSGASVTLTNAGEVDVVYGSSQLLSFTAERGPQIWNQDNVLGLGHAAAGNRFGSALTAWNFGRNEVVAPLLFPRISADLAIGVPFETVNSVAGAGAVDVLYGSFVSNGLTNAASQAFTADSIGLGGQAGAHFGQALY